MILKKNKSLIASLLCLSIIFASVPSYASNITSSVGYKLDLRITTLTLGQEAPFSGVLLTTDSLTKMQLEFDKKIAEMTVDIEYKQRMYDLQLSILNKKLEQETLFRNTQINMRDSYIEELELKFLEKDDWSPLWYTTSFLVGCLTTIAIAYSLKPAY